MRVGIERRGARVGIALTASLALFASACGSSKHDATTSASAPAPTLHGKPIDIAIISDAGAAGAGAKPEIAQAAQARVQEINAHGGIKGRPLKLTSCDTKGDPNTALACARSVASSGAVAVVGMTTTSDAQITPALEQAKLASIGPTPLTPVAGSSRTAFCFNPGIAGDFLSTAPALAAAGAKKVGLLFPGDVGAVSANAKAAFAAGAQHGRVATGPSVGFASDATQFDAPIAQVTEGGVDGVVAVAPGSTQATLTAALRQQRPNVTVGTISVGLTPQVISALGGAADGVVAVALTQPASATSVPGIKQFDADMDAYAKSAARTDLAINAWAAVWAFEQVAKQLPTISRASVLTAMGQVKDLDLGGIFPPLSASARSPRLPGLACAMNTKVVFEKVSGGKLVALKPGTFYDPFGA